MHDSHHGSAGRRDAAGAAQESGGTRDFDCSPGTSGQRAGSLEPSTAPATPGRRRIGAYRYGQAQRRSASGAAPVALILDTGPLFASLDRNDDDHKACRRLIEEANEALLIPSPVLVEVDYWIHARLHPGVLVALLDDIHAGAYRVENLVMEDYVRIRALCDRYADAD